MYNRLIDVRDEEYHISNVFVGIAACECMGSGAAEYHLYIYRPANGFGHELCWES